MDLFNGIKSAAALKYFQMSFKKDYHPAFLENKMRKVEISDDQKLNKYNSQVYTCYFG